MFLLHFLVLIPSTFWAFSTIEEALQILSSTFHGTHPSQWKFPLSSILVYKSHPADVSWKRVAIVHWGFICFALKPSGDDTKRLKVCLVRRFIDNESAKDARAGERSFIRSGFSRFWKLAKGGRTLSVHTENFVQWGDSLRGFDFNKRLVGSYTVRQECYVLVWPAVYCTGVAVLLVHECIVRRKITLKFVCVLIKHSCFFLSVRMEIH